jgi:hypothetical protein
MSETRIIIVTVALVSVLSALSAASASASWFVGGTELKTSAALATTEVVDEIATMLTPLLGITIVCSGGSLKDVDPQIIAGNSVRAEALKFLGCNVTQPAMGCSLEEKNQTIDTTPITAQVFLGTGDSDRVVYSPQSKATIANIPFNETNTCAFASLEPVKGSITDSVPGGQLEEVTETLVGLGSVENNSLEMGGDKVVIDGGRALVKLASGSKWSFR